MMSFAEFCAGMPVEVVGGAGVVDMLGNTQSYDSICHRFQQELQPTDVVYYYCSKPADWDRSMGCEGLVLVRDGNILDEVVLRMN